MGFYLVHASSGNPGPRGVAVALSFVVSIHISDPINIANVGRRREGLRPRKFFSFFFLFLGSEQPGQSRGCDSSKVQISNL